MDTSNKFSKLTVILHWLVGLTIIGLLGVGLYMEENEVYSLYPIHKSIGILVVVFVLWRVIRRVLNGWPSELGTASDAQRFVARLTHWILILGTIIMPVSGMMMSGGGGHGLDVFGFELLPPNYDPADPQTRVPLNADAAKLGGTLHHYVGLLMIGAIVLHVLGALKHHFVDKDGTLRRMFGADIG